MLALLYLKICKNKKNHGFEQSFTNKTMNSNKAFTDDFPRWVGGG